MSSYYGNVDPDISRKYKDENEKEYRNRLRNEILGKISIWNKSPPPPSIAKKQKDKVINKPSTDQFGRELNKISNSMNQNVNDKIVINNSNLETSTSSNSSSSSSSSSSGSSTSSSYIKRKKHGKNKKKQQKYHKASKRKSKSKKDSKKKKYSSSSSDSSSENNEDHNKSKSKRLKTESYSDIKTISSYTAIQPLPPPTTTSLPISGFNEYDQEEAHRFRRDVQGVNSMNSDEEDMEELGPKPMVQPKEYSENKTISYGGALMPGEGAAIAQFVQQNLRIPRRGEIGWQGTEIENLEKQGFVMSGSRHARMNAIRLRKENQVYSAEEKRALALITFEEKQQKENKIVGDFRSMLTKKLGVNSDNLQNNDDNY